MKRALAHLGQRLLWALIVVVGVGTVTFFLSRSLPGDPAQMLLGPQARPAEVERARRIYGLDQPLWRQYARFWRRLLHRHHGPDESGDHKSCATPVGPFHIDMGFSYRYREPVAKLIAQKAPASFELALAALALQAWFGLLAGIAAARGRGRLWGEAALGMSLLGVCAPTFVVGLALQYVFAYKLRWLPFDGYGATRSEQLRSLVLPALTLGAYGAALYARLVRDEVSRALGADFVRAARAKGASEPRVLVVHALRSALVPIVTLMALDLGALVGGAVVTERVFRWPGMGAMAVDAMIHRDGPVIFGTVLFAAAAIVVASLLVDLLTVLLDPRLRR